MTYTHSNLHDRASKDKLDKYLLCVLRNPMPKPAHGSIAEVTCPQTAGPSNRWAKGIKYHLGWVAACKLAKVSSNRSMSKGAPSIAFARKREEKAATVEGLLRL